MFGMIPFYKDNEITRKQDMYDRFFDYILEKPLTTQKRSLSTFNVDVKENDELYELIAELPGVNKEDIHIDYENNYFTISVVRNETSEEVKENYIYKERHTGSMERTFYFNNILTDGIKAEFKNGILKVHLPKSDLKNMRKKIDIN